MVVGTNPMMDPATYMGPAGLAYLGYNAYQGHRKRKKQKQQRREAIAKANLDLLGTAGDQGGSFSDIMDRIRQGYQGKAEHLPAWLEQNKAMLATSLLKTDAAKDVMDTGKFMGATYAPGVGNVEQGIGQAVQAGAGGLAMSGLSASGAAPALAMNARLQGGIARGNMYASLMSQHLQNRMNLQSDVAGMALGFSPPARPGGGGTDYSGYLAGVGSLLGATLPLLGGGGGSTPAPKQGYRQAPTQGNGGGGGLY